MTSSVVKYGALAALCIQNCALILSMRYSRSVLKDNYYDSTIIIAMELTKLVVSTILVLRDGHSIAHLATLVRTSLPISIPSVLYVIQNSCQLMAVQYLDAGTFSVLSQAKVLTTAICSVVVLRTMLSLRKWRALTLLVLGCILVQYAPTQPKVGSTESERAADAAGVFIGLVMTLIMVSISGVAGVTIEKILKNQGPGMAQMSLWERNVQLSFWGIIFATGSMVLRDRATIVRDGFFHGWSTFACVVVVCQSVGGLVTAVVVKYTDTIIKGFAVGLSVVFTSLLSIPLFGSTLTLNFCIGAGCVLLSIFNFNEQDAPIVVHAAEERKLASVPGTPFASEDERLQLLRSQEREEELEMQKAPLSVGRSPKALR